MAAASPVRQLWLGTHPSGVAGVSGCGSITLADLLARHPAALGTQRRCTAGDDAGCNGAGNATTTATATATATVTVTTPAAAALPADALRRTRTDGCGGGREAGDGDSGTCSSSTTTRSTSTTTTTTATNGDDRGAGLPFLLKVLSIGTALSIQAHPDRRRARQLHARAPQHYPDDGDKPELAIALTPFHALCGFRRAADIAASLDAVPELRALVGDAAAADLRRAVSDVGTGAAADRTPVRCAITRCLRALLTQPQAVMAARLRELVARLRSGDGRNDGSNSNNNGSNSSSSCNTDGGDAEQRLCLQLSEQYADDVGCFFAFLLNHVELAPGEAIFIGANVPHAYLSGGQWRTLLPAAHICVPVQMHDRPAAAALFPHRRPRVSTTLVLLRFVAASAARIAFSSSYHHHHHHRCTA